MFKTFQYSVDAEGVALITMDIPGASANVISNEFRDELDAAIARIAADPAIKGAIITSAKNDFMAGGDLKFMVAQFSAPMTPEQALGHAKSFAPTLRRLETCGKPFVAAINGPAMGGGLELALACHYRIAANGPKVMLGLPEVTLGLMPGAGGTQRLPRLIGVAKALPIILKGAPLSALGALEKGVIQEVAPAAELVPAAKEWILGRGNPVQPWDKKGFVVPGGAGFANEELGNLYNLTATSIARETNRNLPAPMGALTAIARGTIVPFDAGLHIEACQFAKLLLDPTAVNMVRTMFVNKGELDKLVNRPKGIEPAQLATIGIIGAGLMGAGVAHVSGQAGLNVVMLDASAEQAAAAKQRLADGFAKLIAKGRMKQDKADAILARIKPTGDYADLADCDLVVEAVFENVEVKQAVFKKAIAAMKPGAILASNTSTLPITDLGQVVENPGRFIGLHFFSPVDRMPLVEVIVGQQTSPQTLAHALDYIKLLRKTPIIVKDSRGFFTTRVISAYITEAFSMVGQGISPAMVDNVAKMAGYPIGPISMMDDIGMENGLKADKEAQQALGDAWKEPPGAHVIKMLCETLDRKGRRHGKGFYDYPDDKRTPWAGLKDVYPPMAELPSVEELKQRLMYAEALEALHCMEEGVLTDPAEGDVGAILGIGFPSYTGGVFSLVDTVGLPQFVGTCDKLADKWGERFRPSAWLRERAAKGERFYPLA
jgi:3-hydroxyacyl-CoA dehydrogenase/enoyl-CoA hydratase/3-hydroxybutyryl-CoA epimerase